MSDFQTGQSMAECLQAAQKSLFQLKKRHTEYQKTKQGFMALVNEIVRLSEDMPYETAEQSLQLKAVCERQLFKNADLAELELIQKQINSMQDRPYRRVRRKAALGPSSSLKPESRGIPKMLYYRLDKSNFAVQGKVLYNIKNADINQKFQVTRESPRLELFPIPASLPENGYHLMVIELRLLKQIRQMGLFYTEIVAAEKSDSEKLRWVAEKNTVRHRLIHYRIRRGAEHYMYLGDI